jgi:hypothetical protein
MAILKRQMLQQAAAQQQSATQKAAVGSLLAQTSGAIQPGTQVTTLVKTLPPQTAGIIPQVGYGRYPGHYPCQDFAAPGRWHYTALPQVGYGRYCVDSC